MALFALAAVVLGLGALARWPTARDRSFDPDEFHHVQRSWLVSQGRTPFRDFYDHHAPLGYLLLAPVLAIADAETDPAAATRVFRTARVGGWLVSALLLAATWRLGAAWAGAGVGALSAVLLAGTTIFAAKAIEIRPDTLSIALWLEALRLGIAPEPRRGRWVAAGALVGLAVSLNLKILLAAPAIAGALVLGAKPSRGTLALLGGIALGIAPTIAFLAAHDVLDDFARHALLGSVTAARTVSPWRYASETLAADPGVAVLGVIGVAIAIARAHRSQSPAADVVLAGSVALPLASLVLMPEPWRQFFLLLLPGLAVLAARLVSDGARAIASGSAANAVLAGAILASSVWSRDQLSPSPRFDWDNRGQLARIRWLVSTTPPGATVLAGWGEPAVFRPPVTWRPFHPLAVLLRMDATERAATVATLERAETRPAVVFLDAYLERLSPRIPDLVREHYVPAGPRNVFVRRDVAPLYEGERAS